MLHFSQCCHSKPFLPSPDGWKHGCRTQSVIVASASALLECSPEGLLLAGHYTHGSRVPALVTVYARHCTFGLFGTAEAIKTRLRLFLRWRGLATRESPRTAAGPTHSCAGHRCVGP